MKNCNYLKKLIFLIAFCLPFSFTYAQYTLTDDDVVVTDGIITHCSYDFSNTDIIIPPTLDGQTVKGIGSLWSWFSGVFDSKGITSVSLPNTLTYIGDNTFNNNPISNIDFSNCTELLSIGYYAFYACQLESVNLTPCANLKIIGKYSFAHNSITSLSVENCTQIDSIDGNAFSNNNITSLDLSSCSTLKKLGNYAFYNNSLANVSLPNSIIKLGEAVFNNNQITMLNSNSFDGIFYARKEDASIDNSIIVSFGGNSTDIVIPSSVERINAYAFSSSNLSSVDFSSCTNLKTIDAYSFYSNSLNSIDLTTCTNLEYIGWYAFVNNNFGSFTLPTPANENFKEWLDGKGNSYSTELLVNDLETFFHAVVPYTLTDEDVVVTDGIIESCSYDFAYRDIIIPETLDDQTVIAIQDADAPENGVFYRRGTTSVEFPSTIQRIGYYAFYDNYLVKLDLSNKTKLEAIGESAFGENYFLRKVDLSNCSSLKYIEYSAFSDNQINSLNLNSCTALKEIQNGAFNSNMLSSIDLSSCTKLEIIGDYGFSSNVLSSIDLSSNTALKKIGYYAFQSNELTSVKLPGTITKLGYAAFNSNKITSFNGESSDGIFYAKNDDGSFNNSEIVSYGGTSTHIVIPSQVIKIGYSSFNSSSLTSVDFSNCINLANVGRSAFNHNSIQNIDLSNCTSLINIGWGAFSSNNLNDFVLPTPNIANATFNYWENSQNIQYNGGAVIDDISEKYKAIFTADFTITLTITDGTNPIEGAIVSIDNDQELSTDASGVVSFTNMKPGCDLVFGVSATGYKHYSGVLDIVNDNTNYNITLQPETYYAIFHISSGGTPVDGAIVQLSGYDPVSTDSEGTAIISDVLAAQEIPYTVSAADYDDASGTITVVDEMIHENVNLIVTGFEELKKLNIKVYPNPFLDQLSIESPNQVLKKVELYDIQGKKVEIRISSKTPSSIKINTQKLKSGTYFLQFSLNSGKKFTSTLVK